MAANAVKDLRKSGGHQLNFLDHARLTQKALLPLVLMAVCFAATIVVGALTLGQNTATYRSIVDDADPAVLRIAQLIGVTNVVGYSIDRNFVYVCRGANAIDCARTDHDLQTAIAQGERLIVEAIQFDPEHRADYQHFRTEFRAITTPTRAAMVLALQDKNAPAEAIMAPVNDRILALSDELTRFAHRRSRDVQAQALKLEAEASRTRLTMIGLGLLAAAGGIGVAAWMSIYGVTTPLARLGERMNRLANGDLDSAVEGQDRRDEIGDMARAVQVFKENAIARLHAESEAASVREAAAQAARDSQAELARVGRVLSVGELASSIAHEINQPMAAIVTNSEASLRWLGRDTPNIERARSAIDRTIESAHRASAVIKRIREMQAKSESAFVSVQLNELFEDVLRFTQDERRRAQVIVRTRWQRALPAVHGDPIQLQQVMLNLIMNGIDAMKGVAGRARTISEGSRIEGDREILISVADRGVGLAPGAEERLFDPFFTTKQGGVGLGLPISRSIIESHGGHIWATAGKPDGTVFSFTLPRAPAGNSEGPHQRPT